MNRRKETLIPDMSRRARGEARQNMGQTEFSYQRRSKKELVCLPSLVHPRIVFVIISGIVYMLLIGRIVGMMGKRRGRFVWGGLPR